MRRVSFLTSMLLTCPLVAAAATDSTHNLYVYASLGSWNILVQSASVTAYSQPSVICPTDSAYTVTTTPYTSSGGGAGFKMIFNGPFVTDSRATCNGNYFIFSVTFDTTILANNGNIITANCSLTGGMTYNFLGWHTAVLSSSKCTAADTQYSAYVTDCMEIDTSSYAFEVIPSQNYQLNATCTNAASLK